MYFSINIPYRKVVFQVRVEQAIQSRPMDLARAIRRNETNRKIQQEIQRSREQFFLLPRQ
jgi:hypothetical protein